MRERAPEERRLQVGKHRDAGSKRHRVRCLGSRSDESLISDQVETGVGAVDNTRGSAADVCYECRRLLQGAHMPSAVAITKRNTWISSYAHPRARLHTRLITN